MSHHVATLIIPARVYTLHTHASTHSNAGAVQNKPSDTETHTRNHAHPSHPHARSPRCLPVVSMWRCEPTRDTVT